MNRKAFTLIEVMVVVAIISIMASMMVPAVWKWWENEEIATTKQRLEELKIAMVGDRKLFQNGVRTNFGYVGDHGFVPVQDQLSSVKHYLPAGFNTANYLLDAWGNPIEYAIDPVADVKARFSSKGINGESISLDVSVKEVAPTFDIDGIVIVQNISAKSVKIKSTVVGWIEPTCAVPVADPDPAKTTKLLTHHDTVTLPIGAHKLFWCYYSDTGCTNGEFCQPVSEQKNIYIQDGMMALSYQLLIP